MTFTQSTIVKTSGTLSSVSRQGIDKNNLRRLIVLAAILTTPILFAAVWLWNGLTPFKWDATWYHSIASGGYHFNGNILRQQNVAFLPGYPVLLYIFHLLTRVDLERSQYFVGLLCYVAGSLCFYYAFRKWFAPAQSALIIFIFSANPFCIYLFNGYSETLFYLLCAIFFLGIATDRLGLSAVVLSIALITRPHAATLYPVLIFKLATRHQWRPGGLKANFASAQAYLISLVDHSFLTIVFPILLTVFWYLKFGDAFLYSHALSAWTGGATGGWFAKLHFIAKSLVEFHPIVDARIHGIPVKVLAPSKIAAVHIVANLIAIPCLLRRKLYEIALFGFCLLIFWFITSGYGDSGRQVLMLLPMPTAMSFAFMAAKIPRTDSISDTGTLRKFLKAGIAFFCTVYVVFALYHFVVYAAIQMGGGWIS